MNKMIFTNLCTVCHESFNFTFDSNRKLCPGCRVQKRERRQERGHKESFIFVSGRTESLVG